jgi:hydroxypyruvate reductase
VINVARRFPACDQFTRRGDWLKGAFPLTTKVSGKRMGILGLGRIGQTIARRASGFDMAIRYHNRKPRNDVAYDYEPSLKALAEWCDFLVIASAGGAETKHLVSREILEAVGPKGFVVNISRGSVIDEDAMIEALAQGRLGGAGLDVYTHEPNVPERLLKLDNVVLLPHLASATHETRQAMADLVLANLHAYFESGQVKVAVPPLTA